jgi:hypothetical protein
MKSGTTHSPENKFAEARAEGILDPVILYLDKGCTQARAVYHGLHGAAMAPRDIGSNKFGAIEKLDRGHAIRLLRTHCGRAGARLGDALQRRALARYSMVDLWEGGCQLITITEDRRLVFLVLGYDPVQVCLHASQPLTASCPLALWNLELDDGELVPLCSPNPPLKVGLLVRTAATRRRWVWRGGKAVREVEAFDSNLAGELLQLEDDPAVIAEAVRALRKLGPDQDRWLMSVLWGRRPLRALARRVEHELTGA